MDEIIKILCERDDYTKEEAKRLIQDTMTDVYICIANGDFDEAEEIFTSELGLEIDYLLMIL